MNKVFNLMIVLLLSITSFSAFSLNANDDANESKVKETVINQIEYPDFAKEQNIQGDVFVCFSVSRDGKVVVLSSNSAEEKLQNYVVQKMKTIDLSSVDVQVGYTYNVKFSFQLL